MMRQHLIMVGLIVSLTVATLPFSAAHAASNNPDADTFLRIVCYRVKEPGNINSRDHNISVIVEQIRSEEHQTDASYFLPGNANSEEFREKGHFNVYLFKNAAELSAAEDLQGYAADLLDARERATTAHENLEGMRRSTDFVVRFKTESDAGAFDYIPDENSLGSLYFFLAGGSEPGTSDVYNLFCEPWFVAERK